MPLTAAPLVGIVTSLAAIAFLLLYMKLALASSQQPAASGAARCSRRTSTSAISAINGASQWQHSFVAGDRASSIAFAESEHTIRLHVEFSGIPDSKITDASRL